MLHCLRPLILFLDYCFQIYMFDVSVGGMKSMIAIAMATQLISLVPTQGLIVHEIQVKLGITMRNEITLQVSRSTGQPWGRPKIDNLLTMRQTETATES